MSTRVPNYSIAAVLFAVIKTNVYVTIGNLPASSVTDVLNDTYAVNSKMSHYAVKTYKNDCYYCKDTFATTKATSQIMAVCDQICDCRTSDLFREYVRHRKTDMQPLQVRHRLRHFMNKAPGHTTSRVFYVS